METGFLTSDRDSARPVGLLGSVCPTSTYGIGSLPHRHVGRAVEFSFDAFDLPTIPSLPRRSPAEASIAQALVGASGITLGQYGAVAIDLDRLDGEAEVITDLHADNFVGFRKFLDAARARAYRGPVKWQFVGPISVGVALRRAGATPSVAFEVALGTVQSRLLSLTAEVADAMPWSSQLVVLDEPFADDLMTREFPISPGEAADLVSAAMAAVEPRVTVGVHCCADVDVATLLESGPQVLSMPVSAELVRLAGHFQRFLENGGWIAWGVVPTDGPIGVGAERSWHRLSELWAELANRGCDPALLRNRCLLTPECGLGRFTPEVAQRVCDTTRAVSMAARATFR